MAYTALPRSASREKKTQKRYYNRRSLRIEARKINCRVVLLYSPNARVAVCRPIIRPCRTVSQFTCVSEKLHRASTMLSLSLRHMGQTAPHLSSIDVPSSSDGLAAGAHDVGGIREARNYRERRALQCSAHRRSILSAVADGRHVRWLVSQARNRPVSLPVTP